MALIAIDFDHTLVEGDKAIEGAKRAVNILREKGHKIIIHSCNNRDWIIKTLNNNDIRYDEILSVKPRANLYIDDRAYRFTSWSDDELDKISSLVHGMDNRKW